jgi:hypothetical protein
VPAPFVLFDPHFAGSGGRVNYSVTLHAVILASNFVSFSNLLAAIILTKLYTPSMRDYSGGSSRKSAFVAPLKTFN